ncbi:ABC transporter substrate-binding protein [Vagococcus elongatus]|uniref:Branched-chain amino acid ABC transporter substrate-binding protein n=1 Tax=Vagococcus elongatus TaxID=180344 RepID=A0A430AX26_9ENTE|nr:ABC transporter substrate-binding protein [Vagococcus elongatus]RSU12610.1 branched-chain amino acid ABC transporter substrate-binding protein [Vagococcus elongatus]
MKKKLWLLLAASSMLLAACTSGGGGTSSTDEKKSKEASGDTIKIGLNYELSGAVSAYALQQKDAIEMAVKEINDDGGILGKQVELVSKDNKSETAEAASVAGSLAENDEIVAVFGPATSGAFKASIPQMMKAGIPAISPSATDDEVTVTDGKLKEFIFRTCFQDSFQGVILANYAENNLGAKKAVIIGDNSSDYGKGLTKAFKETYKGEIVLEENFAAKEKDFKAMLTKIKGKDFDVIYLPGYYEEAGLVIKQAREMGIDQPVLGADGFSDPKLVELAGASNMNDIYYTSHFSENAPANDKVPEFVENFKAKYKTSPSSFNALAYDTMYLLKDAIERADSTDRTKVKDAIAETKDFVGVTGTMSIDENHNPQKPAVVIGLQEGKEESSEIVEP